VNRFGRVTQVLLDAKGSQFTEGVLTGTIEVPTDGRLTFYVRHGELFAQICAVATLLFLLVRLLRLVRRPALPDSTAAARHSQRMPFDA
jgi:apolipoprotein N-acyltransferase